MGVDTPEIRGPERPEGLKVKEYVKGPIEGKELTIETFKVGKCGRYICEAYLDDGEKLSEHLLARKWPKRWITVCRKGCHHQVPLFQMGLGIVLVTPVL